MNAHSILLFSMIGLLVLDLVMNAWAFWKYPGKSYETNPWLRAVMDKIGVVPGLVATKAAPTVAAVLAPQTSLTTYVLGVVVLFYVYIVGMNFMAIRRAKQLYA